MSDAASRVRVDIRHVQLAEAASCEPASNGLFVAMEDPPPVRSILAVSDGEGSRRALEVTAVVEVAPEGGVRGFHGRFIESDALTRFERVGTEHLSDGEPETDAEGGESTDPDAGPGTQMAMPAPVVDPDESEPIDVGEEHPSEAEHATDDSAAAAEDEPEAAGTDGEATGEDGSENGGARKGKRRRGRKRK